MDLLRSEMTRKDEVQEIAIDFVTHFEAVL